jgi:hypothetical protein
MVIIGNVLGFSQFLPAKNREKLFSLAFPKNSSTLHRSLDSESSVAVETKKPRLSRSDSLVEISEKIPKVAQKSRNISDMLLGSGKSTVPAKVTTVTKKSGKFRINKKILIF